VAAVEFALVSIPFIALIVATIQIAVVFFAQEALQSAAWLSARYIMTGQASGLSQSAFQQIACGNLPPIFSCANLSVDVESSPQFSTLSPTALTPTWTKTNGVNKVSNTWAYSPGTQGFAVIVRLMYPWPTVTAPLGFNLNTDGAGSYWMVGTALVLNEPWPSA
jgi:Flp pilus assembly protein TadG